MRAIPTFHWLIPAAVALLGANAVDHAARSSSAPPPTPGAPTKSLKVEGTHLIVPVSNAAKPVLIGVSEGGKLVQSFHIGLPQAGEPFWLAAYPLGPLGLAGKTITVAPAGGAELPEASRAAFDRIKVGTASDALAPGDYAQPYRDQFHPSTRRGWNNDPNGMVYHGGKYHLYYQHNPFGIAWGNMHWGHLVSADLLHWEEQPIALFQKTPQDAVFSGGGFLDAENTAGLGKGALFVAFTSTGRGECLASSTDGGLTFTELKENPVVRHTGRDPKVIWYAPGRKWVMAVFDDGACAETRATPPQPGSPKDRAHGNIAFWESTDLRRWTRTGAFTDPDRLAVFECPELFELPLRGKPGESRWVLCGAQNRTFIGRFNGKAFVKESGPHGDSRGALYAAQTFSDTPDGRRIQVGWVRTAPFAAKFPDQIVSQGFTLPQELTLRETPAGPRVFLEPVAEVERLRDKLLAEGPDALSACKGESSEALIEFETDGRHELVVNGIDASFTGRRARVFTDRTFNEVYIDGGAGYVSRARDPAKVDSAESGVRGEAAKSVRVYRLKSIWPTPAP